MCIRDRNMSQEDTSVVEIIVLVTMTIVGAITKIVTIVKTDIGVEVKGTTAYQGHMNH